VTAAAASGGAYRKQLDIPRRGELVPLLAASLLGGLAGGVSAFEDPSPYVHCVCCHGSRWSDSALRLRQDLADRPRFPDRAPSFDSGAGGD